MTTLEKIINAASDLSEEQLKDVLCFMETKKAEKGEGNHNEPKP